MLSHRIFSFATGRLYNAQHNTMACRKRGNMNIFHLKQYCKVYFILLRCSIFFLFFNHYLHSFVFFLVSKLRHALAYCRIEFLKTNRKIDAAERDASAENSIPPEISCCAKPDIDLTEREIAAGDSDRENWVATSFNKVGTTIFEDNRVPQCNTRITNCRSLRSTKRVPQQNPFPLFHSAQCCRDCKARITRVLLRASLNSKFVNDVDI